AAVAGSARRQGPEARGHPPCRLRQADGKALRERRRRRPPGAGGAPAFATVFGLPGGKPLLWRVRQSPTSAAKKAVGAWVIGRSSPAICLPARSSSSRAAAAA